MERTLTLKFFRVVAEADDNITFEQALAEAIELGSVDQREINIAPNYPSPVIVRLERLERRRDFVYGEATRKQVENIPPEANSDGLVPIELTENGGLGLSTAFRYHIPTQCLLIQANPLAVSQSRLKAYLKLVNDRAEFNFEPVATESAWSRFNNGQPRKFIMKIASPTTLQGLEADSSGISRSAVTIGQALHGAYVTVEVSMGRRDGALEKRTLRTLIRSMSGISDEAPGTIEKLSVAVAEDGSGNDMINFLEEHLIVKDELDLPSDNPDRNYELRRNLLQRHFNAHLPYIRERFSLV